jgi:hypothetical protein
VHTLRLVAGAAVSVSGYAGGWARPTCLFRKVWRSGFNARGKVGFCEMAGVKGARASKLSARGAPSVTPRCMRLWKGLDAGGIPAGWVPTAGMACCRVAYIGWSTALWCDGTPDNPFRCGRACKRILPEAELANILHRETKGVVLMTTHFSVLQNHWHEDDNAAKAVVICCAIQGLLSLSGPKTTKHCILQVASTKDTYKKVLPSWLKQLTSITALLLQLASGAARRNLVNLLILDILGIRIYLGGI